MTSGDAPGRGAWRAAVVSFVALLTIYLLTLAPRVTFWDAGEFIAATETWGVPHPPGTPLFVTLARAWRVLLVTLPAALAVNMLSAVCTAAACALIAATLARRTGATGAAAAAALTAGTMTSVWLNATEAEVYAAALLLASAMLAVALWPSDDATAATARPLARSRSLLVYLFALAAPLHASALVAGPAAVFASSHQPPSFRAHWRETLVSLTALVAAGAAATGRWILGAVAMVALLVLLALRWRGAATALLLIAIGISPLAIMLLRSHFDPPINQGNPATLAALAEVVARHQYEVAPLWPRQAPVWLQLANVMQYADWQVALGVAPESTVSVPRLLLSLCFVALGVAGARWHRRCDARAFRALLVLLVSASLGVIVYLNLKAGPSIGWGILPDSAPHEARERDYFFVLAFWCWGLWAGMGALVLGQRLARGRTALALGTAIALLPAALNWRAMDRHREPDASSAGLLADALLHSAPSGAVLVVWGDNDTYPLWEAQQARGIRRDVLVVTSPLLGATWVRDELIRRDSLDQGPLSTERAMVTRLVRAARARGRPVAFAATVPADVRALSGAGWHRCGLAWIDTGARCDFTDSATVASFVVAHAPTRYTESVVRAMLGPLRCGALTPGEDTMRVALDSLAPSCNVR